MIYMDQMQIFILALSSKHYSKMKNSYQTSIISVFNLFHTFRNSIMQTIFTKINLETQYKIFYKLTYK
jgi:hypothetical protein